MMRRILVVIAVLAAASALAVLLPGRKGDPAGTDQFSIHEYLGV